MIPPSRLARMAVAASLAVLAAVPASAAADVGGPDIVSWVNAQRAAHGIPAGIAHDANLSEGCRLHNLYGARNNVLSHSEDPGRPGYTMAGDEAAKTSVLYAGETWTATRNPFEEAPIHLSQLLAPRIDRMGASENQGFGCATTQASFGRPAPASDVTYTYPGNGATGWVTAQVAMEDPYAPGERVGIGRGTRTGPYLYVLFDSPQFFGGDVAQNTTATLTEPGGPVDVAVADNKTSGLEGYLPTGAVIIPRQPLKADTTYTATVNSTVATRGGFGPTRPFTYRWSFSTGTPTGGGGSGGGGGTGGGGTGGGGPGGGGGDGSGGGGGETRPFTATLPTTYAARKPFKLTITAPGRFAVAYTIKSGRKTVKRYKRKNFKAGARKSFTVRVPSRYSRKGKKVKLSLSVTTGGTTYKVTRTITFR